VCVRKGIEGNLGFGMWKFVEGMAPFYRSSIVEPILHVMGIWVNKMFANIIFCKKIGALLACANQK
jgi:hypothetical protein